MKKLLLAITLITVTAALYANPGGEGEKRKGFDPRRLVFGGSIGFGFGSDDYWAISLSPQVGYRLTDRFIAGVGVSYAYSQENVSFIYDYKLKKNQFGLNVFAEYNFLKRLFVYIQPEVFYQNRKWKVTDNNGFSWKETQNDFVPAAILGIGLQLRPVTLSIGYDIIQDDLSPYGDAAFLSIGVRF